MTYDSSSGRASEQGYPQYPGYHQQGYPQPQQAQYYQQQVPPPRKSSSFPILVIVVLIVLLLVVPIVIAGVMMVYMQGFSQGPGDEVTSVTLVSNPFSNPSDGDVTINGGGWTISISAVSNKGLLWDDITVNLGRSSDVAMASMIVSSQYAYVSYEDSAPKWYATCVNPPRYNGNGVATDLIGNEANIGTDEFETVENCYFMVMDIDGDSRLSIQDRIIVYKDIDSDGISDIDLSYSVYIRSATGQIGMVSL